MIPKLLKFYVGFGLGALTSHFIGFEARWFHPPRWLEPTLDIVLAALILYSIYTVWLMHRVTKTINEVTGPRTLVKGTPTEPGEAPDPDEARDLIHVVMSRGAAHEFRKALLRGDARLNPDYHHPADDPDARHAEWLTWGYSRVELAEREASAHKDDGDGIPLERSL